MDPSEAQPASTNRFSWFCTLIGCCVVAVFSRYYLPYQPNTWLQMFGCAIVCIWALAVIYLEATSDIVYEKEEDTL